MYFMAQGYCCNPFLGPHKYKYIYIYIKKKEFEQCRFDTGPLPAARPANIKGAEPRQSRPMADQPQHDLLPRRTSKREEGGVFFKKNEREGRERGLEN